MPYSILSVYLVMRNGGKLMNSNYSSFWFDDNSSVVDDDLGVEEPKKKEKNHILLAGYQRAIGNFVNIVTGKQIPVRFQNNDESYTDGKCVTIGSKIEERDLIKMLFSVLRKDYIKESGRGKYTYNKNKRYLVGIIKKRVKTLVDIETSVEFIQCDFKKLQFLDM